MQFPLGRNASLVLAEPTDEMALIALVRAFHAEDGHPLSERGEQALGRLLRDNSLGLAFKVVQADRVVGYVTLCFGFSVEWGGRDAFLDDLYLEPSARGQGLGRRIIVRMSDAARDAGCAALHLEIMPENRAHALYSKLGFADRGSMLLTRVLRR